MQNPLDETAWAREQLVNDALRRHPAVETLRQQLHDHYGGYLDQARQTEPGMPPSAPHTVVQPQAGMVPDGMPRVVATTPSPQRLGRAGKPGRKGR